MLSSLIDGCLARSSTYVVGLRMRDLRELNEDGGEQGTVRGMYFTFTLRLDGGELRKVQTGQSLQPG